MPAQKVNRLFDFRTRTTLGISVIVLLIIFPHSVNHFIQNRVVLGFGTMAIVALFGFTAWSCSRGQYNSTLTFFAISPVVILILVFSFRDLGVMGALWCFPSALAFFFLLPERQALIVNAVLSCVVIPQAWILVENPVAMRFTVTLLAVMTFSAIFVRVIGDQQQKLETQVVTDHLTGLLNRTLLNDSLDQALQQNRRMGIPMTLIALDLDHFKSINDTHGHDAGDTVLKGVGELLRERIRKTDKVFRIGGEEFLVLLSDTDTDHGSRFAEELRSTVESLGVLPGHKITTSVGLATLLPEESRDEWIKRCDDKLYQAKLNGRNKVVA